MSETEKAEAKTERELALETKETELNAINDKRTGKGTRLRVGQTRGKNPQIVVWEAFDQSKPETNPKTVDEFMKLSGLSDIESATKQEELMIQYLIDGFNDAQYTAASDPIAEYVNPAWSEDLQKQFRLAVRNYTAAMQGVDSSFTLEKAVEAIKPNLEKAFQAAASKG